MEPGSTGPHGNLTAPLSSASRYRHRVTWDIRVTTHGAGGHERSEVSASILEALTVAAGRTAAQGEPCSQRRALAMPQGCAVYTWRIAVCYLLGTEDAQGNALQLILEVLFERGSRIKERLRKSFCYLKKMLKKYKPAV